MASAPRVSRTPTADVARPLKPGLGPPTVTVNPVAAQAFWTPAREKGAPSLAGDGVGLGVGAAVGVGVGATGVGLMVVATGVGEPALSPSPPQATRTAATAAASVSNSSPLPITLILPRSRCGLPSRCGRAGPHLEPL